MFRGAAAFNQPIGDWNVGAANDVSWMFAGAAAFNQPIGQWDLSRAYSVKNILYQADAFQQLLGGWKWNPHYYQESPFLQYSAHAYHMAGVTVSVTAPPKLLKLLRANDMVVILRRWGHRSLWKLRVPDDLWAEFTGWVWTD
jgi:hypothetical protein